MKLIRVGIVVGKNNKNGNETLIKMLSEPDFFELCTPVIFGSLEAAEEAIKAVEPEQKMSLNVLKDIKASIDGRINLVDNLESEKDAISIAVNAYLDNCIDAVVIITNEIYNTPEKPKLTALIAEAMQHENSGFLDWVCNGEHKALNITSFTDIATIKKSLRWDNLLIQPRIAVVSKQEDIHEEIVKLREEGYAIFGPFNPEKEETKGIYSHYDALLFYNEAKANSYYKDTLNTKKTYGYISGLPMVLTYTLRNPETSNLKEALYAAIDIDKARMAYRQATYSPLEKMWNPKGRDDFKLDLSKTDE